MAFCYILRCADGSFYMGSTQNLSSRLNKHADGSASSYTAVRRPVALAYFEELPSIAEARAREQQIKGWTRAKKAALVGADHAKLKALSRPSRPKVAAP